MKTLVKYASWSAFVLAFLILVWVMTQGTRNPRETLVVFSAMVGLFCLSAVASFAGQQRRLLFISGIMAVASIPLILLWAYVLEMMSAP